MWTRKVRPIATALVGAVALSLLGGQGNADELRDQLASIRKGYLANRKSFTHGTCRFRYSIWTADSEADALAGRANSRRKEISRVNTLLFRDDTLVVAPEYDPAEAERTLRNSEPVIPPLAYARKGDFAIDADGLSNTAILYNPETIGRFHLRAHPFALATDLDFSPAATIEFAEARNYQGINFIVEDVVRDGRQYLLFKTRSEHSSHDQDEYIDPARGYLSFITERTNRSTGQFYSRMFLLDVHEVRGRCFPLHAITVVPRTPREGTPYVEVREMKVLELDLDHEPRDDELVVPLHRETQYSDGVNPNTAITLYRSSPQEFARVSVHEIEAIYNGLQRLAVERLQGDKSRFLRTLQEMRAAGDFSTGSEVHLRALFAVTEADVRAWWRGIAEQGGEAFDPEQKPDLHPFLAVGRGLAASKRLQDYAVEHFADIQHPSLKLAWAAMLFQQERRPPQIIEFLRAGVDSEKDADFLATFLGADWPEFKAELERPPSPDAVRAQCSRS